MRKFQFNNIILQCEIRNSRQLEGKTGDQKLCFLHNKFTLRGKKFTIRLTKNLFYIFCETKGGIRPALREFLIKEVHLEKNIKLYLNIVNIHLSISIENSISQVTNKLFPFFEQNYEILECEAEQEANTAEPISWKTVQSQPTIFRAFRVKLRKVKATINFQPAKNRSHSHIVLILNNLNTEFITSLEQCISSM